MLEESRYVASVFPGMMKLLVPDAMAAGTSSCDRYDDALAPAEATAVQADEYTDKHAESAVRYRFFKVSKPDV